MKKFINKLVKIITIYSEEIICVVLTVNNDRLIYKNDYGTCTIPCNDILDIIVIGEVCQ